MIIQIGTAEKIDFVLVDGAGAEVPGLGGVFTVNISKNGGAMAAGVGAKTEIGSGWYSYTLTAAETDTAGPLALAISGAGTVQQNLLYHVEGYTLSPLGAGTDYCTLVELKAALDITDAVNDAQLSMAITAVSRQIDNACRRRFYTTVAPEIRYYTPEDTEIVFPNDDILTITNFATDADGDGVYEETWAATDYILQPVNAAVDAVPYTWITITQNGDYIFPLYDNCLRLTGTFGYCAIANLPLTIRQACLIQCTRIFKRKDSPFGVVGLPELGVLRILSELDPDVQQLIEPYKKVLVL